MRLRDVNNKLRMLEKKQRPKVRNWKGYPPIEITEESAVAALTIVYECAGMDTLAGVLGEELAIDYFNTYLCTDDSYVKCWYD